MAAKFSELSEINQSILSKPPKHRPPNVQHWVKTPIAPQYFGDKSNYLHPKAFINKNLGDAETVFSFIPLHLVQYHINSMKFKALAITAIFSIAFSLGLQAQDSMWKTLGKITYKKEYDEMMGFKVDVPVFSNEVQKLEGKEVTMKGYIIPVEGYKSHKDFIFSAYPYSMCFFCGGAGPETVLEVKAKSPVAFSADPITIKGTLHLNSTDINKLMYSLSNVEMVK